MSDHTPSLRRRNKFAAVCLSLALVTGTSAVATISAPVALAQSSEQNANPTSTGDEQPETSSWDTSSIATDDGSVLDRTINVLSLLLAVGGIVGISASLIMHFADMALPSVPWKK